MAEPAVFELQLQRTSACCCFEPARDLIEHHLLCFGRVQRVKTRLPNKRVRDSTHPKLIQGNQATAVNNGGFIYLRLP